MACVLKSLASNSSISTCSSQDAEGEVTPRSSSAAISEPRPAGDTSPSSTCWADELDSDVEAEAEPCDELRSTRPPALASRPRGATWRAVWCYERCYKEEEEPIRTAITAAVTSLGGSLFCFKKARTFEARAPRMFPNSYALITDGREARPCVQALAGLPHNLPALVIVLSEQPKHAARVTRWAEGLPAEGFHVPVFVVSSAAEIAPILADRALTRRGAAGTSGLTTAPSFPFNLKAITAEFNTNCAPSPNSMTSTSPSLAMQRKLMGCGDATRTHCAPWPALSTDATWTYSASRPIMAQPMATDMKPVAPWPTSSEAPFLLEKSAEGVEPTVLCVLSAAVPSCAGQNTLQRLLTLSAPEVYEE